MKSIIYLLIIFISNISYSQIENDYREQLNKNPRNIQAYTGLISLAKNTDALLALKLESINTVGHKSIIYTALGNSYTELKDYNNAVVSYRQALHLNPRSATSYNRLGLALMRIGLFRQSEVAFKSAIALTRNPKSILIYETHLVITFENLELYNKAKSHLDHIFTLNPQYNPALEVLNRLKLKVPAIFN